MKPERWSGVPFEAKNFITCLLEVDPNVRLTAQQALEHPWIARSHGHGNQATTMKPYCEALREFSRNSKFRRCCLEMLAWSLSNEDQDKVRDIFLAFDESHQGTITLGELRHVMVDEMELVDDDEFLKVFQALDYNHDQEIHYSEFLAAMLATQIQVNDEALTDAFRRFDVNHAGYITAENLRDVLGHKVDGQKVEAFIREADQNKDGVLSFAEFAAYVRGTHLENLQAAVVDAEGQSDKQCHTTEKPKRKNIMKSALKGLKANLHCFGTSHRSASQPHDVHFPPQNCHIAAVAAAGGA